MKQVKLIYAFIAFAALAQGVLWINVFSLIHKGLLTYIGGIPAGVAIVGLVVYSANQLPRVASKRARNVGWFVLVLVCIVEPVVLGFANYPVIMGVGIGNIGAVVVAGGASLTISLALVLGALVDRSLVPAEKPNKPATSEPKPAKKRKQAEVEQIQPAIIPLEPAPSEPQPAFVCSCGFTAKSQPALNAHQRKHKQIAGYAVSFEPIPAEKKQ
jgi:hypothetical protein